MSTCKKERPLYQDGLGLRLLQEPENALAKHLSCFVFLFTVTSATDFSEEKFLQNLGVYGKGLWRRESKLEMLGKKFKAY